MSKKKKIIIIFSAIFLVLILSVFTFFLIHRNITNTQVSNLKELPKPEITGGARGELGIDKNINETTIDEYLNREDSVYRDMRMLEDPGNYEAIGGDRFLSGYIEGFEVIPLPYIIPVTGLPSQVGNTYTGTTLFYDDNGTYVENYKESMSIIEEVFPKDKVIFLMCGGGGYAGMTKNFLVSLGWDENKIYNTGGYWYYKGEHSINVKKEVDGVVSYDFDKVPYHNIEFDKLTKSDNYREPTVKVTELKINTSKIEIEEGTSFKLNVIVLPNEAANKEVKWTSSNETIATVTQDGLVKGIGAGNATIIVESIDGNKTASCEVIVNKRVVNTHIKLDDITKEAKEFQSYSSDVFHEEFEKLTHNSNGELKDKYSIIDENGQKTMNDLYREELNKLLQKIDLAREKRIDIINKMIDNKKSFVIIIYNEQCEERDYSVLNGAMKILNKNNHLYIYIDDTDMLIDGRAQRLKLDESKLNGTVAIIKKGEIFAYLNPDVDAIKNDEEVKNWFSKYIDIK